MRRLLAILCLLCTLESLASASIAATAQWDVRTGGASTNGGGFDNGVVSPGTNEAIANSGTAISCTLAGTGTTATCSPGITSTTHGPGNIIQIASGSGCTTGYFEILSQAAGVATFDRSMGTATDVCVGVIGGGLDTIAHAITPAVTGNILNVQNGTYTVTAAITFSACLAFQGYNSTWGDLLGASQATIESDRPVVTTATNSTILFNLTGNCGGSYVTSFMFMKLTNTAATNSYGICPTASGNNRAYIYGVYMSGFSQALAGDNGATCYVWLQMTAQRTELTANTKNAMNNQGGSCALMDSWIHDNNTSSGNNNTVDCTPPNTGSIVAVRNLFTGNNPGTGSVVSLGGVNTSVFWLDNDCYNTSGSSSKCLGIVGASVLTIAENSIVYDNGIGINTTKGGLGNFINIAFGSNATADIGTTSNYIFNQNPVTLSAGPFTNAGSNIYTLNSTAGGGAASKAAAYPGIFPDQLTTGYLDIGAAQSQGSAGGGNTPYSY